jgi:hypothetical protein
MKTKNKHKTTEKRRNERDKREGRKRKTKKSGTEFWHFGTFFLPRPCRLSWPLEPFVLSRGRLPPENGWKGPYL